MAGEGAHQSFSRREPSVSIIDTPEKMLPPHKSIQFKKISTSFYFLEFVSTSRSRASALKTLLSTLRSCGNLFI